MPLRCARTECSKLFVVKCLGLCICISHLETTTSTAQQITQKLKIPTIGIGSSVHCDGQVLVTDDLIGLNESNIKFVKKFLNVKKYINLGLKKFVSDVRSKKYPSKKYSY